MSYSRSSHNNRVAQIFAIFFKAVGLPTRAFEVMHQAAVCMTQRWSDLAVKELSADAMMRVEDLLIQFAAFFSGDNVNLYNQVFSTRASNRNNCESGTAITAFITPHPPLSAETGRQWRDNVASPRGHLRPKDLMNASASQRIHTLHLHFVISILLDSQYFANYPSELKNHELLQAPKPHRLAAKGPENKMNSFMLPTLKIDQAFNDGNAQWMGEALKRTGYLSTPERQKNLATSQILPIIGDELTQSRFRSLKRFKAEDDNGMEQMDYVAETFGLFHAQMCLGQELFQYHAGEIHGCGLLRDASMLKRKHFIPKRQTAKNRKTAVLPSSSELPTANQPKQEEDQSAPPEPSVAPSKKKSKRKKAPSGKEASRYRFHDLDELIHHTVEARVLACWMRKAGLVDINDFKEWDPSPRQIQNLAHEIVRDFASLEALPHAALPKTPSTDVDAAQDEQPGPPSEEEDFAANQRILFENGVRYLRDGLVYCLLRKSVRIGDVGTIEDLLPLLAIMYKGGNHPRYMMVMLETMQQLKYEYPPEMA